ncbi:MAG: hypothetical protein PQJ28_01350 [Spirochaetales bacterium]|nr:hypothetical protein [Spirochaetales bacterium]
MDIVTVSFIALGVLVLMLSFGVPLPFCFGGALMVMVFVGDATMNGTMVWATASLLTRSYCVFRSLSLQAH